jgi:hypothetical protein
MDVFLTTYLFSKEDPQAILGGKRKPMQPDSYELMRGWYDGVVRLRKYGVIFHDGLSDEFVQRYATGRIRFVRIAIPPAISSNDWRFVVYHDWLEDHPAVRALFCTDLRDVVIRRDPFQLLDDRYQIWAGNEPHRLRHCDWLYERMQHVYGRLTLSRTDWVLNAGTVGGYRTPMLAFLSLMTEALVDSWRRGFNTNMAVFNHVLYNHFGRRRVWRKGRPLHSVFARYQMRDRDVCFLHK